MSTTLKLSNKSCKYRGLTLACSNRKLGKEIWNWSIPAIITCPGATAACKTACYAKRGHYTQPNVQRCYARNLSATKRPGFVANMQHIIATVRPAIMRVHCAGDFYSAAYIRDWIEIIRSAPDTRFYAYTRSWRVPELLPELRKLAQLPNIRLWFSIDKDSRKAPRPSRVGLAYMLSAEEDEETIPAKMNLVFRVSRRSVKKRLAGAVVCPPENGVTYKQPVTCTTCSLCWRKKLYAPRSG